MKILYRKNKNFFFFQFTFRNDFDRIIKERLNAEIRYRHLSDDLTFDIIDINWVEKGGTNYATVGVSYE